MFRVTCICRFLLVFFSTSVWADTVGILPVRVLSDGQTIRLNKTWQPAELSSELAALSTAYLKFLRTPGLLDSSNVANAAVMAGFSPMQRSSTPKLTAIARGVEADRLLLIEVRTTNRGFQVSSQVYYLSSNLITDPITSQGSSLLVVLGNHLEERFPVISKKAAELKKQNPGSATLLVLDGNADALDWQYLRKKFRPALNSINGVCAGDTRITKITFTPNLSRVTSAMSSMQFPRQGATTDYSALWECARSQLNSQPNATILAVMGDKPNGQTALSVKSLLRQISRRHPGKLLLSGTQPESVRQFWQTIGNENSQLQVENIRYALKTGHADGSVWYVFRTGNTLIETRNDYIESSDNRIEIPLNLIAEYSIPRTSDLYRRLAKVQLIDEYPVSSHIHDQLQISSAGQNAESPAYRALLHTSAGPFWFDLPRSFNPSKVQTDVPVWLAVSLTSGNSGNPLMNQANLAEMYFSNREVPKSLLLPVREYLLNPNNYLGKSIGGTSLYIIEGTLKSVRVAGKRLED